MANSVAHFKVCADDLQRAMDFYGTVFGWRFEAWGPPDFYLIQTGEGDDTGLTEGALEKRRAPAMAGGLTGYLCSINVVSIAETIESIEARGGRLRGPLVEIPQVGQVVEFEDTEGNVVCAVQYVETDKRAVR